MTAKPPGGRGRRSNDYETQFRIEVARLFEKYRKKFAGVKKMPAIVALVRDELQRTARGGRRAPSPAAIYRWHGKYMAARARRRSVGRAMENASFRPSGNRRSPAGLEALYIRMQWAVIRSTVDGVSDTRIAKLIQLNMLKDLGLRRSVKTILLTARKPMTVDEVGEFMGVAGTAVSKHIRDKALRRAAYLRRLPHNDLFHMATDLLKALFYPPSTEQRLRKRVAVHGRQQRRSRKARRPRGPKK